MPSLCVLARLRFAHLSKYFYIYLDIDIEIYWREYKCAPKSPVLGVVNVVGFFLCSGCVLTLPCFFHIGRTQSAKAAVFIQKRYPWQKYNDGDLFVR